MVSVEPWSRFPERRYALMPLKPTPGDTPQALNIPHPIDVESRSTPFQQPEPIAIYQGRQRRAIERITSRWYLNDEWWLRPIRRRYFILLLEGGVTRTVYHDLSDQLMVRSRLPSKPAIDDSRHDDAQWNICGTPSPFSIFHAGWSVVAGRARSSCARSGVSCTGDNGS